MGMFLTSEERDALAHYLEEHKRISAALKKLDDPNWTAALVLSAEEEPDDEDPYVDFPMERDACKSILEGTLARLTETLREYDIECETASSVNGKH